jgi:hypothetical protein
MPRKLKRKSTPAVHSEAGRLAIVFEEEDLARLLRAAIDREGGQSAFAKRYNVDRSRVNRILSGQLRASEAIAKALGLRRIYIADP